MSGAAGAVHPRTDRERTGAGYAIRMAPFNMAGVAGLLTTCAAVAASAAHLLPLLLLLICPRGTQSEQGELSSFFFLSFSFFTIFHACPFTGKFTVYRIDRASRTDDNPRRDTAPSRFAPIIVPFFASASRTDRGLPRRAIDRYANCSEIVEGEPPVSLLLLSP